MSKVSISGNDSGNGTFTIAAPNSNNNRTFSLPDEAGTALTDASNLEPQVKTSLNATGDAPMYACRSWVNFNGEGTVSIRESGNVSSITDNGTGNYTVNFSTAMTDENYATSCEAGLRSGVDRFWALAETQTSGSVTFKTYRLNDKVQDDSSHNYVAIFR